MKLPFPIQSGLLPGENRETFRKVKAAVEETSNALANLTYRQRADRLPEGLPAPWPELVAKVHAIVRQAEEVADAWGEAFIDWAAKRGCGEVIDDDAQVLALLPPHRVTARPTFKNSPHGTAQWKIALKPKDWPVLAGLAGLDEYDLRNAVNYHIDPDCPRELTPAQAEALRLNNTFEPLRRCGFGAGVRVVKVTKANILAVAWVCHGER